MTESATVDIVDVKPAAQRIPLHALQVGDIVFDAFGGEHRITHIWTTAQRTGPLLWIFRDDRPRHGECLGLLNKSDITIIPSFAARRSNPTQEV